MSSQFLDEKIIEQVKEFFKDLENPVKILFFGSTKQNCDYCADTLALLSEIANIHEKITIHDL